MIAFIDQHKGTYAGEPICRLLPTRRSARPQRDEVLRAIIRRIYEEHHRVYGPRKVWKQMGRVGCTRRAAASIASCARWA